MTSTIKRVRNVGTFTQTGTTQEYGNLYLSSLPNNATPIGAKSSDPTQMCLVWQYESGTWYVSVAKWQTLAFVKNTAVTLQVSYVYNS